MELPSRDFFAEIENEQTTDEFINELNEDTRIVEEPEITDEPEPEPEEIHLDDEPEPDQEPKQERFCTYDEEAALYVNLLSDSQKVFLPNCSKKESLLTEIGICMIRLKMPPVR